MWGFLLFLLCSATVVTAVAGAPLIVIFLPASLCVILFLGLWSRSEWWPSEVLHRLERRDWNNPEDLDHRQ